MNNTEESEKSEKENKEETNETETKSQPAEDVQKKENSETNAMKNTEDSEKSEKENKKETNETGTKSQPAEDQKKGNSETNDINNTEESEKSEKENKKETNDSETKSQPAEDDKKEKTSEEITETKTETAEDDKEKTSEEITSEENLTNSEEPEICKTHPRVRGFIKPDPKTRSFMFYSDESPILNDTYSPPLTVAEVLPHWARTQIMQPQTYVRTQNQKLPFHLNPLPGSKLVKLDGGASLSGPGHFSMQKVLEYVSHKLPSKPEPSDVKLIARGKDVPMRYDLRTLNEYWFLYPENGISMPDAPQERKLQLHYCLRSELKTYQEDNEVYEEKRRIGNNLEKEKIISQSF